MWKALTRSLLRNRIAYVAAILALTGFFAYRASKTELSYNFAKILPKTDSMFIEYEKFKQTFGEDGNVMVMGIQTDKLFQQELFNDWNGLNKNIKTIKGVKDVLSLGSIYDIHFDDSLGKFSIVPVIQKPTLDQAEVDAVKARIEELPFYKGLIYNPETNTTMMAITFNDKDLNSKNRLDIVKSIKDQAEVFQKKHGVEVHYSGMPFIRSEIMKKVSGEMRLFMILAVLVTALILWLFFRSFSSVFFSLLIAMVGVVWSLGFMNVLGYKITILSGLIPPLIIVIGIPNCVFFINRYHREYVKHQNKAKALARMISSMGITLFLANVTTAIGFAVLYFTNTALLVEFGIVAAINVMLTYMITLVLIPIILSFLPPPAAKHTRHLEAKYVTKLIGFIDRIVLHHRKWIYGITLTVTVICIYGMTRVNFVGYVVDDLPEKDKIYTDLKFFEAQFHGVLPFEVKIDAGKENGIFANNAKVIYKIKALERIMSQYPVFSKPLSINEGIKFAYQAYKGGDAKYYTVPSITDLKVLSEFVNSHKGSENKFKAYLDSNRQVTRVSYQMADIGSAQTKELMADLQPKVDSLFAGSGVKVSFTGHSLIFLKGNDYLLDNLIESLIIEILLITIVGLALFRSLKIIILSKLPCLIPLVITAGVMGFLGIRFKPSTILIFSIAFGIASDGTVYFLTRYRQELKKRNLPIPETISACIRDIGVSMVYTAVILFSGFSIFIASGFGGTVALGVLISLTLLVSMCTNLILLPSILISLDRAISKKEMIESEVLDLDDEEDDDDDDSTTEAPKPQPERTDVTH